MRFRWRPCACAAVLLQACAPATPSPAPAAASADPAVESAARGITADALLRHMRVLSSDAFLGRAPGTAGEDSAVAYIAARLREAGVKPGMPDGGYVQQVPMIGIFSDPSATITTSGQTTTWRTPDDWVAWATTSRTDVRVDASEMVFVGYGVVAPELGWDDFKGVDVRGKTIVMLVGDPPVPDPRDSTRLDSTVFRGRAMTYYGRWTYKYDIAAARGAAAAIIVHETEPAGYGWSVVASNTGRERFEVQGAPPHVPVEGWMQLSTARGLFRAAGLDYDRLKRAARERTFRPVPLRSTATFHVANRVRQLMSRNVIGRVDGSDPALRSQYVLYTAHWDHFGVGRPINGDSIYHGALDNASGIGWLLETARAFARLPVPPRRTVVFMAVTAEEQGLLGARYYAAHPVYPLERTVADINMDIMNPWGRANSIVSVSYGQSTLEDVLARFAAADGRAVKPDPEPEKGYFYRSDHFELSRRGVPALAFLFPGADYASQPPDYGQRRREEYVARDYHKPSDVVKPDWDLTGAVDDTRLLFRVGLSVANTAAWPAWKPGTEFRAAREEMLRRAPPPN